jgi:hypothetical protein
MEIWERHTIQDILKSLEIELAKAQNEINCASKDLNKASSRLSFVLTALHQLKKRDIQE